VGIARGQRTLGDIALGAGPIGAGASSGTEDGPGFARDASFVWTGACRFEAFATLL
jgi:hypothetical protein